MFTLNEKPESIQGQIEANIKTSVQELFGIEGHSLQIASLLPAEAFMKSIDNATMEKTKTIAAQNQLNTKTYEAQQLVATATGEAHSAIQRARGESDSVLLTANAEKTRLELTGKGKQASLAEIKPFGSREKYIAYLEAQAKLKWNGQQPQIVAGTGAAINFVVPIHRMCIKCNPRNKHSR